MPDKATMWTKRQIPSDEELTNLKEKNPKIILSLRFGLYRSIAAIFPKLPSIAVFCFS